MSFARVHGPGHPDRTCDLVAASVVSEYLCRDPEAILHVSVIGGQGVLFVAGDVASQADFDVSSVVERALGEAGVTQRLEPFIAFEPMAAGWAAAHAAREPVFVTGYATDETHDGLPRCASLARAVARRMERLRNEDADGFWLGSDYDVSVQMCAEKPFVIVRAEHVDQRALKDVREQLTSLVMQEVPDVEVRVNPSGEEIRASIAVRLGCSGRASSADAFGALIPIAASGVGRHFTHPLNAGACYARKHARELIASGHGRAVMVRLGWLPLEPRPFFLHARNERGNDLSKELDPEQFTLDALSDVWRSPTLVLDAIRWDYDASVKVPWEGE
mgnify:CR=1 FL=1